jgi:RimJ/RimL family protein N-acetyltransferase
VTATLKVEPVVLEGKYVRLEPLTLAHEKDLARAAADGELWHTDVTIIPKPHGMKDYIEAARKGFALGFELPFAIVRKIDSVPQVVGTTRFYEIFAGDRKAAIGYTWLGKSAQRTPVNTEAKLLLLTHAFETWKCVRVELITDVLNDQSRAAILRLGAKHEGILRNHLILPSGRVRDSVVFSIIDSEWPEVKTSLLKRLRPSSP